MATMRTTTTTTASPQPLTLYTDQSPNGVKISIALEELGIKYNVYRINMTEHEQKSPWFLEINPNGRIPALIDTLENGQQVRVFESGSILQYLTARYDHDHLISYPLGSQEQIETTNWLFFQNAGVGPMQGQLNHFYRYSSESSEYALSRYRNEVKRLYQVANKHLEDTGTEYLVGNKCTIADISLWTWVTVSRWAGIEGSDFSSLKAWEERMFLRPGVERGRHVPDKHHREMLQDPEKVEAFHAQARAFFKTKMMKGEMSKEGITL